MNEDDLHQRLRSLNSCGNTRQQGIVCLRTCLIAEVTCSIAAMIVEESRELRAAARQLREEAARLRWERLAPEAGDAARTLPAKG